MSDEKMRDALRTIAERFGDEEVGSDDVGPGTLARYALQAERPVCTTCGDEADWWHPDSKVAFCGIHLPDDASDLPHWEWLEAAPVLS